MEDTNLGSLEYPPKSRSTSTSNHPDMIHSEPSIVKRRNSSFASTSSPWFRRNSFLSSDMIQNENCSVYELPNYYSDSSSYNIISLRECQGFIFNQDLFASPYQQSRSLANERRIRTLSFSKSRRSSSHSKSNTPSDANCSSTSLSHKIQKRRHTSHDLERPTFATKANISAITNGNGEDDGNYERNDRENNISFNSDLHFEDDHAIADEYDEFEDIDDYRGDASSRMYKVHVTEIVVNENDNSIFPI